LRRFFSLPITGSSAGCKIQPKLVDSTEI
jgi:hypothetical protein